MPDNFTVEEGTCIVTGQKYSIRVEEDGDGPNEFVSPPALVALNVLDSNPELDWVKAAMIKHPNGHKEWISEHSGNTEDFEDFSLEHGALYTSDVVEGFQEIYEDSDDPYFRYQGRIDEKTRSGAGDEFRVTRDELQRPKVQEALAALNRFENEQVGESDVDGPAGETEDA